MRYLTILLTILAIIFTCQINAQRVFEGYLIGRWESANSSTGIKDTTQFERNDTLTFYGEDVDKWKYNTRIKDSIIHLKYNAEYPKITFRNEAILIIQSNNCFWWFNPIEYEKYINALKKGYNITHKDEFGDWLIKVRNVYYRLNTK